MRLLALAWLCASGFAQAVDADMRLKWFGSATSLPDHDATRLVGESPQFDQSADVRLMFSGGEGGLEWLVHHASTLLSGDGVALAGQAQRAQLGQGLSRSAFDRVPTDDARRVADLTWPIGDGKRHDAFHRLDRIALKYRRGRWAFTVGRDAVSWGSGRVFQPMDLFNPFAPTAVDRDFKAGDDLVHAQVLLDSGADIELLAVGRRDDAGDVTATAASLAAKVHGFVGAAEYELLAARHYRDRVYGATLRLPLGGALLRTDIVATDLQGGGWRTSGVLNIDYSFDVGPKNVYVFGEYYHNGFGSSSLLPLSQLSPLLIERLARGEVFTFMRDYTAVGGTVQWHALLTQNVTLITNLHDASSLLQTSFTYDPGDRQRLELGVTLPMGRSGEEYGGVPVAALPNGSVLTSGGGARAFLRWVFYL